MKNNLSILFIVLANFYCAILPAQISLDTTFDFDGKVTTSLGVLNDEATGIAIQPDGKLVVVGQSNNGLTTYFTVIRYNIDGSIDTTFGNSGIVSIDFGSSGVATSVVIQNGNTNGTASVNDKIIVGGVTNSDFALVRLNLNGTLDTSFDNDGIVTTAFNTTGSSFEYLHKIILQSDGKILAVGTALIGNFDCVMARYNTDGSLDTTFGNNGKVITAHPNGLNEYCIDVVLQNDGKIVTTGYITTGGTNNYQTIRYNANGTLDTTFNFSGKAYTDFGTTQDVATAIKLQNDGKILVCGNSSNGVTSSISMALYNANGSLDFGFGTNGKVVSSFSTLDAFSNSIYVQDDSKILIGGTINRDFALVRYLSNGSIDTTFANAGSITTDFDTSVDYTSQMAIQTDGKIILAGKSFTDTTTAFALARYNYNTLKTSNFDKNNFSIYPNPATSILNIQNQKNLQIDNITITDVSGKLIGTENQNFNSINIQNLQAGIYFLQISSDEKTVLTKFIKN